MIPSFIDPEKEVLVQIIKGSQPLNTFINTSTFDLFVVLMAPQNDDT